MGWLGKGKAARRHSGRWRIMRDVLSNRFLYLMARCFVGVVFIVASIEKIAVPEQFAVAVEAYKLLPISLVNMFALFIPWLELLCGIFLVGGVFTRGSSLVVSVLLSVFLFGILSAMMRQLHIDCGCFGPKNSSPVGWPKVMEDLGLLLLGIYLYVFSEVPLPDDRIRPAVAEKTFTPNQ